MKFSFRPALALLLGTALAATLTACDYGYGPGRNQVSTDFSNPPHWRHEDVLRDSINYRQTVLQPTGEGSATAIKKGSTQDKLNSAPSGSGNGTEQTASGQMAPIDQNTTTNTAGSNADQTEEN